MLSYSCTPIEIWGEQMQGGFAQVPLSPAARGGDWTREQQHGQVETVTLEIAAFGGLLNGNNTVNLTGTTNVTFTDGTVDLARFPATPPAHGGHYSPGSTELFNIAVISGFNAAEDFIDLRGTDISTQFAQFTTDIYDIGNQDFFGTDTRYTSFWNFKSLVM